MGRYLYANRRHAVCLYNTQDSSPKIANTYLVVASRSGKLVKPDEVLIPYGWQNGLGFRGLNSTFRNEQWGGRFGPRLKATINGRDFTFAGTVASVIRQGQPEAQNIPVALGRDFGGACADAQLSSGTNYDQTGFAPPFGFKIPFPAGYNPLNYGDEFTTNNGLGINRYGYPFLVQKTAAGFGEEHLAVTLTPVDTEPPAAAPLPIKYTPLHYLTLWRVTGGGAQALDRRVVYSATSGDALNNIPPSVYFRAGLARDDNGQSFAVVHGVTGKGCVVTLKAQYTPVSSDACLFGDNANLVWAGIAHRKRAGLADSMRLRLINHDDLVGVAFEAGCLGLRDIQPLGTSGRASWQFSRYAHQPNTATIVSVVGRPQDAPDTDRDTTTIAPIVQFSPGDYQTLAIRTPVSQQPVQAKSLCTRAFRFDTSGMARHAQELYALRDSEKVCLLGSGFASAEIEFVARYQGSIERPLPFFDGSTQSFNGTEDIDADMLWSMLQPAQVSGISVFSSGFFTALSLPVIGAFFPPLGKYSLEPLSVNGVQAAQGMLTAPVSINLGPTTTSGIIRQFGPGSPIGGPSFIDYPYTHTLSTSVFGQVYAFFDVGLQEHGQYSLAPEGDVDFARWASPTPEAPQGKLTDVAFHTAGKDPGPVLRLHLFTRTVNVTSGHYSYDKITYDFFGNPTQTQVVGQTNHTNRTNETAVIDHGTFTFNRAQTAALMAGQSVTPTTWQTAPNNPAAVQLSHPSRINGISLAIKSLTLNATPLGPLDE